MELLLNDSAKMKNLYTLIDAFRMETAEKLIADFIFENKESKNINYIGELNKNDAMF